MSLLTETLRGLTDHFKHENLNYYDCGSQTQKWVFLVHISAKLKPAQVKLAPFPISSGFKCLGWINKSMLLIRSLWRCNIFNLMSNDSIFTNHGSSSTARVWLTFMT